MRKPEFRPGPTTAVDGTPAGRVPPCPSTALSEHQRDLVGYGAQPPPLRPAQRRLGHREPRRQHEEGGELNVPEGHSASEGYLHEIVGAPPVPPTARARHEVVGQGGKSTCIRNRHVGLLHLEHTDLWLGPAAGPRLVTCVPLGAETRERLERPESLSLARSDRSSPPADAE
ncbi:hypothetical protein [Streptomyces sp. NBC_00539]|uniref:hypothetical protein n=1 Tax=Streptomyces sp. NBC_00539 TaxID=2975770 RepID=UPI003FCE25E8